VHRALSFSTFNPASACPTEGFCISEAREAVQPLRSRHALSGAARTHTGTTRRVTAPARCKVLCHVLVVLIYEMHELGIDPLFSTEEAS
jgi:hypothetical protein